ncbi:MAG: hypothetical protein HKN43_17010 [Rhodothermales bacterium]|nr:hypothetical protein [Rhodothermales bacterium]
METALSKYIKIRSSIEAGTVTAIKAQKSISRVSLYLDESFAFGLAVSVLAGSPVKVGQRLSAEVLRSLLDADFKQKARHVAFNYLSFRARTASELRLRLNKYSGSAEFVEEIVEEFIKLQLVDDESYALEFVSSRHRSKGHGPSRLRSDLMKKGVNREIIEAALSSLDSTRMDQRAEDLLRTKWRSYGRLESTEKRRNRSIAFLLRRGYNYGIARDAYNKVENDSTDQA